MVRWFHLLAWSISGPRTLLLCGNQGDNCCQATTGLDQCAYTVKKQHSVRASAQRLYYTQKKEFQSPHLKNNPLTATAQSDSCKHTAADLNMMALTMLS